MSAAAPIAITCGEPAGIGPEIIAKARLALPEDPMFVLGNPEHFKGFGVDVDVIDTPGAGRPGALAVLAHDIPGPATPGRPDPAQAAGVVSAIARAVDLVQRGAARALCTAPINKKALKDGADFPHPGHTEYLAALAGADQAVMMLACPDLRVVPATIHIPLADVPNALTPPKLEAVLRTTHGALRTQFGIAAPRIAVAGLNPHAGEGGTMGNEELYWIEPLIKVLGPELGCFGPLPADTMFHKAARARYDAAVCMYHDQALIPLKTIDFEGGVNVTLGLPFLRTSPDHGTAFDIAGTGQADPTSMVAALRMAGSLARTQQAA